MQTEVRENQKEETRGRKAFLRVDDKKEPILRIKPSIKP
jgi:hypothetical protein